MSGLLLLPRLACTALAQITNILYRELGSRVARTALTHVPGLCATHACVALRVCVCMHACVHHTKNRHT